MTVIASPLDGIVDWHWGLFSGAVSYTLESVSRGNNESLTGRGLINGTTIQRFVGRIPLNTLHPRMVADYRATILAARGRQRRIRMPVRDFYLPQPIDGPLPGKTMIPYRFGVTFSNGSRFCRSGPTSNITCDHGDDSFVPSAAAAPYLTPGVFFGVGEDCHQVRRRLHGEPEGRVYFEPAARRDHVTAPITLRPTMLVRFDDDAPGVLELDEGRWGRATLSFYEDPLP